MSESFSSGELRDLQLAELKILKELNRVCSSLGIRYLIFSGTLLGAVRHKGFIPWDDDVDVVMFRKDYEKFLKEGPKELKNHFFIQNVHSDLDYPSVHTKLRDSTTTYIEDIVADRDMNHGIMIDIFPIDGVPKNRTIRRFGWFILSALGRFALLKSIPIENKTNLIGIAKGIGKIVPISGRRLTIIYSSLCALISTDQTTHVAFTTHPTDPLDHIVYPKDWFIETEYLQFEDDSYPAPAHFKEILTQLYGDYMELPPQDCRFATHNAKHISTKLSYNHFK